MKRMTRGAVVAVLGWSVIVLAGCGGSGSPTSTGETQTTTPPTIIGSAPSGLGAQPASSTSPTGAPPASSPAAPGAQPPAASPTSSPPVPSPPPSSVVAAPAASLKILQQPVGAAVALKGSTQLGVVATGPSALGYQWHQDGVAILGETGASLSITGAAVSDTGTYHVVVSDAAGAKVNSATVNVMVTNLESDTSRTEVSGRVAVIARSGRQLKFPQWTTSWQLRFQYVVPPLPTDTWDHTKGTFYIWGDADFDDYGSGGRYPLSQYVFNQVVPELILGGVLAGNHADYSPFWENRPAWGIRANYYWQRDATSYAQTGPIITVQPGDVVSSTIDYSSSSGKIIASISSSSGTSSIVIDRPFPNEPTLFASWSDFFAKAQARSGGPFVLGYADFNIEPYGVDKRTMCSVLPFAVTGVSVPGIGSSSGDYAQHLYSKLPCAGAPVRLAF